MLMVKWLERHNIRYHRFPKLHESNIRSNTSTFSV